MPFLDYVLEYALFLLQTITILAALILFLATLFGNLEKVKSRKKQNFKPELLNESITEYRDRIDEVILNKDELKSKRKKEAKKEKEEAKKPSDKPIVYLIEFDGDIRATGVDLLGQEISAVLDRSSKDDEVVVKLKSPGGMVTTYGLGASQLKRVKDRGIKLTVCIDEVAASGGYLMACVADNILAAPFAILGSIGVVAEAPNFNRLLKKNDIDYDVYTAGKYKRTITMFGENTEEGKAKFKEDLNLTHDLFKAFVAENRPSVDIENVATGEFWYGKNALDKKLVDQLMTSDEYLMGKVGTCKIVKLGFDSPVGFVKKAFNGSGHALSRLLAKLTRQY